MGIFSFLFRRAKANNRKSKTMLSKACLHVEALEDRALPNATSISGFVFADANNNGLFDPGETPIANAPVQLRDANNNILGNATTDAAGFYQFTNDPTISQTPITITKTLTFPSTQTDYTLPGTIAQFDPSLGQLQSVQVTHAGSITSDIKVENTSPTSTSSISGTVGGSLELTGPGVDSTLTMSQNAGSFNASAYDGTLDYGGTSGTDFGAKTASDTKNITLSGSAMSSYIGAGTVAFTENAHASSYAAGGGNLNVSLNSSGTSTVTVTYTYIPSNNLKPGNYTVIQTVQPSGYTDGKISAAGTVIPHQTNVDVIPVTLDGTNNSANNDFGKLVPAGLTGYVYSDANNNGIKEPGEAGIAGSVITLTGTNDLGPVSQTATTDATGFYQFANLRPGTYTLNQDEPASFVDGKDTAGSLGGTVTHDQIANINLPSGGASTNNNFGEFAPASLSGYVYADANNNGVKDAGETPIAGNTITLTGTNSAGPVSQTATTDANGFYQFTNLQASNYTITQSPPANYLDGKATIGSQGGTAGNDVLSGINLATGVQGTNNNFGELVPAGLSGYVYIDSNNNGVKDPGESGLAGATVTLTGFNDQGPINATATTDASGFYQFQNLRPGNYALTETNTSTYVDGKDLIGSQGGTVATDNFSNIILASGVLGVNNNFAETLPANADLGIVKTASAASVPVGATITYTLTVTNYGTSTAQSVKVLDTLPPDAIYQNANGTGWTISQTGGTITATLPSLAVNANSQITVTVKAPAVADTLTNTATVSSATPDSNPSNNSSSVTTTVVNQPGTTFPQGITPLVNAFGQLPALGKIQLFGVPTVQFINPVLLDQMTFVSGAFETFLGRAPSYAEFQAALGQLESGVATTTIATNLWNSDEHRALQANMLYQTFLGRSPTYSERHAAIQSLQSGTSEIALSVGLVNSAEFQASHPTPGTIVAGLYQSILNEVPDASTQLQAASALANESVGDLATSLMTSTAGLGTIVNQAFLAILRRPATQSEVQSWVTQIQGNQVTIDQMEIDLLASPEFYQLAARSTKLS